MLLIDTGSIYAAVKNKFADRVDYRAYEDIVVSMYGEQTKKYAYVNVKEKKAHSFVHMFKRKKYVTRYRVFDSDVEDPREFNFNVELTIDAISQRRRDVPIIIGSTNSELEPLLSRLHRDRYAICIFACGVPPSWRAYGHTREITINELIGDKNEQTRNAASA